MKNIMYTDQTGAFPIMSSQGNWYLMIICEINSNMILVQPMKNQSSHEMSNTCKKLMNQHKVGNTYPSKHILDNEVLDDFLQHIKQVGIMHEKVPQHMFQFNSAEKAIQKFKNHFIAILSGVHKQFPMYLWDQLLLQTEMVFNML